MRRSSNPTRAPKFKAPKSGEKNKECKMIKLFLTDVDGSLTDGGRYLSSDGTEMKKFSIVDGTGLLGLKSLGVKTGIVTAESGDLVKKRAETLKMDVIELGCKDKLVAVKKILFELHIDIKDVAFFGDDINDLELLMAVGFPGCPRNAQKLIKRIPNIWISELNGGDGAVRDFIESIIDPQALYNAWNSNRLDGLKQKDSVIQG